METLETVAIILLILWAFGLVLPYAMVGLINILLVVAVAVVLIRFFKARGSSLGLLSRLKNSLLSVHLRNLCKTRYCEERSDEAVFKPLKFNIKIASLRSQ